METDKNNDASAVVSTSNLDGEGQQKKLKYPKSIGFIIGNEFCERFNFYGMRTILVLYLSRKLDYSSDSATVIFHVFTMMVYLMGIFGAIIADSWLGKFKTIMYLSMVYVAGSLLVSFGAMPPLNLPGIEMTIMGLLLIAFGSGGIKPCVSAFGGDQFQLPEQLKQMATFFSLFYFSINSGSLISTTVTPILREVYCFGETSCYSLAFGVPAILMATSIVIFVLGRSLYISKPPAGNMFLLVSKAIGNAISTRGKERKHNTKEHWLDYAEPKYGQQLIDDIKVLLRVLVLYIPLPVFWALFDQQGSRWTFQATRMDGAVGTIELKPDQMQMLNPLLILIFIPLYDVAFYPLLNKIGIRRPLQKLTIGGCLAGLSFIISGVVELQLENTYPVLPSAGLSQLRIYNGIPNCPYTFSTDIPNLHSFDVEPLTVFEAKFIGITKESAYAYDIYSSEAGCESKTNKLFLEENKAVSYFMRNLGGHTSLLNFYDNPAKPEKGDPIIRVLANLQKEGYIRWQDTKTGDTVRYNESSLFIDQANIISSVYDIYVNDNKIKTVHIKQGGVYTLIISESSENSNSYSTTLIETTPPNSFNILWLIPQYVTMTLGEVMFSVTGLEFSYAQAPESMKSVLQACWQLTVAVGNLIVVIVAEVKAFNSQAYEFFLFAGLMFVDMILFAFLAMRYKPNNPKTESENTVTESSEDQNLKKGILNPNFEQN